MFFFKNILNNNLILNAILIFVVQSTKKIYEKNKRFYNKQFYLKYDYFHNCYMYRYRKKYDSHRFTMYKYIGS